MFLEASGDIDILSEQVERVLNPFDLSSLFHSLYDLRSAAPDDDDDGDEDNDESDGDEEDEEDSGSGGTGKGKGDKDDKSVDDPDKKRLSDEAAKYRRLRREEREKREAAEARLRELEDKDKGDAEKLTAEVKTLTTRAEAAEAQVSDLAREVAIARASRGKNIADHDLLEFLLTKEKVEYLDEDGEIADLGSVVDELIKKKPSLVATGGGKDDEDDDDEDESKSTASGKRTDGKGKGNKSGVDQESLRKKFPALAR